MPPGGVEPHNHLMARPRVLLCDDISSLRLLLRLELDLAEIEVIAEAENGREAIEMAEAHQPDVIVLDVQMPIMGGLDALPEIRRVSPESRVIVLSSMDGSEVSPRAIELGASAYFDKETSPGTIAQAILDNEADS